jgi:Arc/MetJ-type ribon-helix-helix transcriptional regulator
MKLITLYLPHSYIEALDELISEKLYADRSQAIRDAVRDLLKTHDKFGNTVCMQPKTDYTPPNPRKLLAIEHAIKRTERRAPKKVETRAP